MTEVVGLVPAAGRARRLVIKQGDAGLRVDGVRFPEGSFLDVGTPEDLRRALLSS